MPNKALFRNFPVGTKENEENSVRIADISAAIRKENLPITSLEAYRHRDILGHCYKISFR
jgi:hypothetical protein